MNSFINITKPKERQYKGQQNEPGVTGIRKSDIFWPHRLATIISVAVLIVIMASCDSELTGPELRYPFLINLK